MRRVASAAFGVAVVTDTPTATADTAARVGAVGGTVEEAWEVAVCDGFEGGDGGGEDADVGFDDGPILGGRDCVGCVF